MRTGNQRFLDEWQAYLDLLNQKTEEAAQTDQTQYQNQGSSPQIPTGRLTDMLAGSGANGASYTEGGTAGTEAGGGGANAGLIGAAIIAQMKMAEANYNKKAPFEGQRSGGVLHDWKNFATEPWLANITNDATAGEKFSAALKNDDYGTALKRSAPAGQHWTNPIGSGLYEKAKEKWGKKTAGVLFPDFGLTDWLSSKF